MNQQKIQVQSVKVQNNTKDKGGGSEKTGIKLAFTDKQDATSQRVQHCEVCKCASTTVLCTELKCGL